MAFFSPDFDKYNQDYTTLVRKNVRNFHENLDQGNWDVIESGLAPDYYWNYDGTTLITPAQGKAALQYIAGGLLGGVRARDIYNIVDGNRSAVLFRISGKQAADFFGVPLQSGSGTYDVRSAERFVFNPNGLVRQVTTITPLGIMKDQMRGLSTARSPTDDSLKQSNQTTPEFRSTVRKTLASLHLNVMAGKSAANELIAVEDVETDENGTISRGRDAFAKVVACNNSGLGAFPTKAFHDVDVLADGMFGAIEYVWIGAQESDYKEIKAKGGGKVRVEGMIFFEFDHDAKIKKVVSVYDEGVVEMALLKS